MWIVPPSIQSAFALASGCSKKDFTPDLSSWASEAERSCSLSGKLSPSASWLRAWKKDHWLQRLSGLAISPNSRQDDFADWWMVSSLASRAKTCPLPVAAPGSMESDRVFSSAYSISQTLAVRGSSFWRTLQESLVQPLPLWTRPAPPTMPPSPLETAFRTWALKMVAYSNARLPESWENWPTVGGMRNGSLFLRPMWAPVMAALDGSASPGGWPTPDCNTATYSNGERGQNIREATSSWMTPHGMGGMDSTGKLGAGGEFAKQATQWMTPKASDGSKGEPNQRGSKGDLMLPSMAAQWPTPKTITGGANSQRQARGAGGPDLQELVTTWPTPMASDDGKKVTVNSNQPGLIGATAKWGGMKETSSPLGQPTADGPDCSPDSLGLPLPLEMKRLNPYFVEWLMGWRGGVDFSYRAARLRAGGNGVVPLCAASAVVVLVRRSGIQF